MIGLSRAQRKRAPASKRQANGGSQQGQGILEAHILIVEAMPEMDEQNGHQHVDRKPAGSNASGDTQNEQDSWDEFHHGHNAGNGIPR